MIDLRRENQCVGTLRMLRIFSCAPSRVNSDEEAAKDHERVDFNIHRPTYTVTYLGCDTLYKPGLPEMCDAVNMMLCYHKAKLKSKACFTLCLSKQELTLRDQDGTEAEERVFGLRRILFCGVYKPKQNIFFFNYQFGPKGEQVDCHVVVCKSKRDAKSLAEVIRKAFRESQHDAHIEEQSHKRQHLQGLSKSLSSLDSHGSAVSTVEANRHFYVNLSFARENAVRSGHRTVNPRRNDSGAITSGIRSVMSVKDSRDDDVNSGKAGRGNCISTEALVTGRRNETRTQETGSRQGCVDLEASSQDNGLDTRL